MKKFFIICSLLILCGSNVAALPNHNLFVSQFKSFENTELFYMQMQNEIKMSYEEQSNLQLLLIEIAGDCINGKFKTHELPAEAISRIIDNKVAKVLTPDHYLSYQRIKTTIIGY